VYCRADLSRTLVLVVALLLTAVSTGAFARGLLVGTSQHVRIGATGPDRTKVALIGMMTPLSVGHLRHTERI
jgi:hypothetical protein